jgi:selenocysteine-specific elongation factor
MQTDFILGTAGHIDHGKTSLVKLLTGTQTDRLPEEKKRGITIELGYAQLSLAKYQLGIVDVPGHEKFVRQMLAGATGMDLAMLVIAGDDSIKQQTREHLDIIRMLNLSTGVIALTKCDLVEDDWLEMVEDEVRDLVKDSFLHDAPIIRCSSKTGMGVEALKRALEDCCDSVADNRKSEVEAPFRMAIDRSFSIEGYGTVVTGSVSSGQVSVGDNVELLPAGGVVRIRGLQNHDSTASSVSRGQRAAINLAGVDHHDVKRGQEICRPGHLVPSTILLVQIRLLTSATRLLKDRAKIRFHVGTAELMANVRLMGCDSLAAGQTTIAQVYLNDACVCVWNQPFVIRSESPVETIGGGMVLHPDTVLLKRPSDADLQHAATMASEAPLTRAASSVYLCQGGKEGWKKSDWPRIAGVIDVDKAFDQLIQSGELVELRLTQSRSLTTHKDRLVQVADRIVKTLGRLHDEFPLRFNHPRNIVENEFAYLPQPALFEAAIDILKQNKTVNANIQTIGLNDRGPKLSKGQRVLLQWLMDEVKAAGLQGPTAKQLQSAAAKNKDSVVELLSMAVENQDVVKVGSDGFYFNMSVIEEAKLQIADAMPKSTTSPDQPVSPATGLTVSDIRQILGVSRKYSVPICEYFDEIGFTRRDGDQRFLSKS